LGACGQRPSTTPLTDPDRVVIVASERGPSGARLVAIDEHGDRQFSVIRPPDQGTSRDTHPSISPDGAWIVFASSRGRSLSETSLWIAKLGVEQTATRLTDGTAIDSHPTWSSDGSAIIFASTRDGGDFDLYRVPMRGGRATGAATPLTSAAGHEITPSIATDGTIIYSAVTQTGERDIESHLEQRAPDGTITQLTSGPADSAPAISPDGKLLAFARPAIVDERANAEIWSVIHVDLREPRRRARMLVDRAGAVARLTPAIAAPALDARVLHEDPDYLSELARIMAKAIEDRTAQPDAGGAE
jgi:Tol biopolymer transport system component